jgi:hypothetical protein
MPISHGHKFLTFEDYIPELQADTLIQAAKIKQNLYDEGQSKIQEYYNALSNLPIVRDADKQYMDRELNKIFSVLQNNVGSADFSNPQTVRSYIDIAGPLEKDPILRNAMESTAEYRNRLNTLEKARSSGKYSPANEWQYMNDIEDWISNPNPGAKLQQKQYLPYQDLSKKVGDLASKLKPDVDVEISNMVRSGQIRLDEVEGVSKERLRNAIYASLDPYEQQQLQIDTSYTSAKTPSEDKYNALASYHGQMYNNYLTASRTPQIYQTPDMQRNYAEKAQATKELLDSFVNSDGTANMDNINDAYANYYRDNWDNGMLNAYAYEQRKSKLYNNPISLESIKLANSMSLANKRFQNQMATKGLVPNGQGGFQKAPWYDLVQSQTRMANTKYKPADSPKIFADKDVNDSVMDQFKQNAFTQATYSGTEFEQNFDDNFINRILGKAATSGFTTIDSNKLPVNNVETFTIVKNPDNTISYKIQFKDIDGAKTINDTELNKAYQDFFTGQNVYDYNSLESAMNNYNPAVSTVNQSQFTNTNDALGFLQSNGFTAEDLQLLGGEELPVGYMLTPPTE